MSLTDLHDHAAMRALVGELDYAERALRQVVRETPDNATAAKNLAIVLLSQGNYREGAPLYEARLRAPRQQSDPPIAFPRWGGEPIDGKRVLVWPEQGLGDQIMFARFAQSLQQRGCDVTLLCHPALERLFQQSLSARVVGASGAVEFPDPDLWLFNNSLMPALVRSEADIPREPYLQTAPSKAPFGIGLATRGNPSHANDEQRSLPPEIADELRAMTGAGSLHPEDTGARDFAHTAEIIAGLDLVISVDTSVAHLAGALGKPVWILLPAAGTDWRWQRRRDDSPWYPSARLFRQQAPGDWRGVLDQVREALPKI